MGRNDFAKQLQNKMQMQLAITRSWTAQLCLDCMTLVLNDPSVMGKNVFGRSRLKKIETAFNKYFHECYTALTNDSEASYVRQKIDDRLAQISGDEFEAWSDRYQYWDDRGI